MELLNKYKYVWACFLTLFLFLGVSIYTCVNLWQLQQQRKGELKNKLTSIAVLESFAAKHADYTKYEAELTAQQASLRKLLPLVKPDYAAIKEVQQAAWDCGLGLDVSLQRENRKSKSGAGFVMLEMKAKGDYAGMLSFLVKLESRSPVGVEKLELEGDAEGRVKLKGIYKFYFCS